VSLYQRNSKIGADFIASSVQEKVFSVFSIASSVQENFFLVFSIALSVQENLFSAFSIASSEQENFFWCFLWLHRRKKFCPTKLYRCAVPVELFFIERGCCSRTEI
jgi:hypothetical protein